MTMEPRSLLSRRDMLRRSAHGFGWLALAGLMRQRGGAMDRPVRPARAKNVILLFMDGGVSQVDSFDPKPRLTQEHGKPFQFKMDATQFDNNGSIFGSPWAFHPSKGAGIPVSDLFPHLRSVADELCIVRSMKAEFPEHAQACYFLHTGHSIVGRPSMGSWISYGLGTENETLPSFVVLNGGMIPMGGTGNYSNGFLPAVHQGSLFDLHSGGEVVASSTPADEEKMQRAKLAAIAAADREFLQRTPGGRRQLESAIRNYETAFAMQAALPELTDLRGETEATRKLYGLDSPDPMLSVYARECLMARRLVERGVRFVEVTCVKGVLPVAPWDAHDDLVKNHSRNALAVDQPIAALIRDLKGRGLLDSTLVIFAGEFGRTPFAQGTKGRDHNPQGFSLWMAGGGLKKGVIHGATDDYGYRAIENVVDVHDLHATILHLLGIDHEQLTYRYSGRDYRLTDVFGKVVQEIVA